MAADDDWAVGRFHLSEGLCFERTESGGVRILVFDEREKQPFKRSSVPVRMFEVDDSSWVSVVAHCSARGQSATTYEEALKLHRQPPSTDPAPE